MPESKKNRIANFLERRPSVSKRLIPLRGDASTRSFYRVMLSGRSAVMMVIEDPQGEEDLPYINVRNHLASCGVNVPEIYEYDGTNGILLVEDFGDLTLAERLKGEGLEQYRRYYRLAIDELAKIQIMGTARGGDCIAFQLAFDRQKLLQELDFFIEHNLEGYFGVRLSSDEREAVRGMFADLAGELASLPRLINHRDYHSRNLMVVNDAIGVVDFQDARMGPCQYDLASLLRDSYTVLEDSLRDEAINYYLVKSREMGVSWCDKDEFVYRFDLMSIQRNLKACGTFGYMAVVRGDKSYLRYLEPTFRYVKENSVRFEWMGDCIKILSRYVPMLR